MQSENIMVRKPSTKKNSPGKTCHSHFVGSSKEMPNQSPEMEWLFLMTIVEVEGI